MPQRPPLAVISNDGFKRLYGVRVHVCLPLG
jgi:hypothetical protein